MKHFYHQIQGWFNCEPIYKRAVKDAKDGAKFVEVGAWKGQSAAYMAVEIINSGKRIDFHVVDTFEGSEEHQDNEVIKSKSLYKEFIDNTLPVAKSIILWRQPSLQVASCFANKSLDFVYIDASHSYENVKADIQAWMPKVKQGGILAGDDYLTYSGVKRAVDELLPDCEKEGICWIQKI